MHRARECESCQVVEDEHTEAMDAADSCCKGAVMRGDDRLAEDLFSYVRLEERVPARHPLRAIRALVDVALTELSPTFDRLYAREGRPSIPPERLLRALLLQAFYTVRSERQLMEQLDFNLLFRWFVGLSIDDPVLDATVFCKNRDRLLDGDIARQFLAAILNHPQVRSLLSTEHFSVDGTLIEAWASLKSFVPKITATSSHRPETVPAAARDATASATFTA